MRRHLPLVLLLVTVGTGTASAELVPLGPETRVDTDDGGNAICPQVVGRANGSFEVAWAKRESEPAGFPLQSRHFSWRGLPTEPQRSTPAGLFPLGWELAGLADGGYRLTWLPADQTSSSRPWRTRLLGPFGRPLGGGRLSVPGQVQFLSARPGGGFVGGWTQPRAGRIVLQLFDAAGRRVGAERQLDATRLMDPAAFVFDHYADGGFVVLFAGATRLADGTSEQRLRARRFDADGDPIGEEILVNTTPAGDPVPFFGVRVAALPLGGLAVAWSREELGRQTIYLRVFDGAGQPLAEEAVVASGETGSIPVFLDGLDADAQTHIGVLWREEDESCNDVACRHLFAQLFDGSGGAITEPVAVDSAASAPFERASCGWLAAAGGRWVVSWLGWHFEENRYAIFSRRFSE